MLTSSGQWWYFECISFIHSFIQSWTLRDTTASCERCNVIYCTFSLNCIARSLKVHIRFSALGCPSESGKKGCRSPQCIFWNFTFKSEGKWGNNECLINHKNSYKTNSECGSIMIVNHQWMTTSSVTETLPDDWFCGSATEIWKHCPFLKNHCSRMFVSNFLFKS